MRRVLRSLRYDEEVWRRRSDQNDSNSTVEELTARRAYAHQQAKDRARVREGFESLWRQSTPARGRKAGPMDREAGHAASAIIEEEVSGLSRIRDAVDDAGAG